MIAGYGTSPDDRVNWSIRAKVSLTSYRIGAGYFKSFNNHYLTGIQTTFNNQEYVPNKSKMNLKYLYHSNTNSDMFRNKANLTTALFF
jgi:hypothetical protein